MAGEDKASAKSNGPADKRRRLSKKTSDAAECVKQELVAQAPDAHDNERYFCEYAHLYHQMDMLEDSTRTDAYRDAIVSNRSCFEGKVVMDVGAGTCILAIFAAQAGAKHVYAVEATDMAERGRKLVNANGLGEIITVIQGTVETTELPCKVDVIVSEWMGYLLLRESMLDSVLFARDKYLKKGGSLFPSHSSLMIAPVANVAELGKKKELYNDELTHWSTFRTEMDKRYGVDFACLRDNFYKEQRKYYLQTSAFVNLLPKQLVGKAQTLMEFDLSMITLEELKSPSAPSKARLTITKDGPIDGLCGYFDAFFKGNGAESQVAKEVTLSTAPSVKKSTHWGQQAFLFDPPFDAKKGDELSCCITLRRQERNHRLLQLEGTFALSRQGLGNKMVLKEQRTEHFFVD